MNQPLTKDDFIYYDAESDSVYFGLASDSEIIKYEEHLFFVDKVQSAVEGFQSEDFHVNVGRIKCVKCGIYKAVVNDDREGRTLCFACVHKKWFPVFVDDAGWLDVSKHVKGYENTLTSLAGKDSLSQPSPLVKTNVLETKHEGMQQSGVLAGELETCEDCDSIKGSPQKKHAPRNGQPIRVSGVKYDDIIVEDETADAYKKVQWPIKKQSPEKICSGCRAHFIDGKCPDTNCGCVYHKENEVC